MFNKDIVDPETWKLAQRVKRTVRRTDSTGIANQDEFMGKVREASSVRQAELEQFIEAGRTDIAAFDDDTDRAGQFWSWQGSTRTSL